MLPTTLSGAGLVELLAGVAVAAANGKKLPTAVAKLCAGVKASDEQKAVAESLAAADKALVLTGNIAGRHQACVGGARTGRGDLLI